MRISGLAAIFARVLALHTLLAFYSAHADEPPAALVFHASQAGKQTLDQGEGGGNPFASALIDLIARKDLALEDFPSELVALTEKKSRGFQRPDVPARGEPAGWRFLPKPSSEKRSALVVVFSDYSAPGGAQSLPGAKHDANRVRAALDEAGFQTVMAVDSDRAKLPEILQGFSARSAEADVALLYTTGHGVEVDGHVFLLPGDYPFPRGNEGLQEWALRLSDLATVLRAKRVNMVFWAGCRDNPFDRR